MPLIGDGYSAGSKAATAGCLSIGTKPDPSVPGRYEADSYGCPPFLLCGDILRLAGIGLRLVKLGCG